MESRSKIILRKVNIISPVDNFYCAGIVNYTLSVLLSEAFGEFRNILLCATVQWPDDVRGANCRHCDGEIKSQCRQEMAHGRKLRIHEKLRFDFLSRG